MSYCPKCGKEVPSDAMFCPYCGSTLESIEGVSHRSAQEVEEAAKECATAIVNVALSYAMGFMGIPLAGIGITCWYVLENGTYFVIFIFGLVAFAIGFPCGEYCERRLSKQIKDILSYFVDK